MNGRDILLKVSWKGQGLMDLKPQSFKEFIYRIDTFDDTVSPNDWLLSFKVNEIMYSDKTENEKQKAIEELEQKYKRKIIIK